MPRGARLILQNACYHVITRGNQKRTTFTEEQDYDKYLRHMAKYKRKYKFKLYGWCLMPNHVHLVIDSSSLSKLMHGINLSYVHYFKRTHGNIGHFWQDRFKSYAIQKDEYLINCITYIEYNPVRARLILRPEDYPWSSYKARVLGEENELLDPIVL